MAYLILSLEKKHSENIIRAIANKVNLELMSETDRLTDFCL